MPWPTCSCAGSRLDCSGSILRHPSPAMLAAEAAAAPAIWRGPVLSASLLHQPGSTVGIKQAGVDATHTCAGPRYKAPATRCWPLILAVCSPEDAVAARAAVLHSSRLKAQLCSSFEWMVHELEALRDGRLTVVCLCVLVASVSVNVGLMKHW
jgi:hypothetical protein